MNVRCKGVGGLIYTLTTAPIFAFSIHPNSTILIPIKRLSRLILIMHMYRCLLILLMGLPLSVHAQSALQVTAISPVANAISAPVETPIVVTFNQAIDPATVATTRFMVFGRWSGVMPGTFTFEANNTQVHFTPDHTFSAGEMVTISLAKGIATPGGESLAKGYAWQFWTRTLPATLDLMESSIIPVRGVGEGRIQTYGAYGGDLDEDGYSDFFVPNEISNDVRIFMNKGDGSYDNFTIHPMPNGSRPSTNEGADFNLDGHIDVAVGSSGNDQVTVFMGNGDGTMNAPSDYTTDRGVRGLAVLDLNGDGYMDIATANRDASNVALLQNTGNGTFVLTQRSDTGATGETAAAAADANEDGILDLFVGSYGLHNQHDGEIILLLGDGNGNLTFHKKVPVGGSSWMITTGDVNGDGHVDVVSANSQSDNFSVILGDGEGNLSEPVTYDSFRFPLAIDLGDLDGDGDLDVVTSNFFSNSFTIFENLGDGLFDEDSAIILKPGVVAAGSCTILHDRDNNGTLDMTGIDEVNDLLVLFTNAEPTSVETQPTTAPAHLETNFPNPFSETTTISFSLSAPSSIRLVIYDLLGREVKTLLDGNRQSGRHVVAWDGTDETGSTVASGLYLYRLETDHGALTKQLLYVPSNAK